HHRMSCGRTLAESAWLPAPEWMTGDVPEIGPQPMVHVPQDVLEPILRAAAVEAGADVRFGTPAGVPEQDGDGITVPVPGGELRADYVIAADGARSPVREALGIARTGPGPLGDAIVSL